MRQRESKTSGRPARLESEASPDRSLEAEAIPRDIEGPAALHEMSALAARNRHRAARPKCRAKLQGLADFVPVFSEPDFTFGVWRYPPPTESGIHALPYCELSDDALAFVRTAYDLDWVKIFDWWAWMETPEGKELVGNPERVATATPAQLAKLLTFCIRADRFNEGFLSAAYEAGMLTAIVLRAKALLSSA